MNKPQGFSLLELLISMALGVVLMALIGKIFITVQNMNHTLNDEVFLQENMRLALQVLGNAIKSAGCQPYPLHALSLAQALHIEHQANGNDALIINNKIKFEVRHSAYPNRQSAQSLYEGIELVPGLDGLHAALSKSDAGKPLVTIKLHMTAPYGLVRNAMACFALRVYV